MAPAYADVVTDPLAEIEKCARIKDAVSRFACYEALGKQILAEDPGAAQSPSGSAGSTAAGAAAIAATAATGAPAADSGAADTAVPELSDDLGGEKFSSEDKDNPEENRGQVTSCQQDPSGSYYFVFANGQVWQQTSRRRYRLGDECDFVAIITRDTFGYKLQIDGDDSKMRVKRIR